MHCPCSGTSALVCCFKGNITKALEAFDEVVYKTREIIRPGRKNEKKNQKNYTI